MPEQQELIDFDDDLPGLLTQMGADAVPSDRWPQMLADLIDVTEAALVRGGHVPAADAKAVSRHVVAALADYLGARQIYLPRGDSLRIALERTAIWHAWDGRADTKCRLARQFRMSVRSIERIVAEQALLHRDRFQGRLFEPPPDTDGA